MLEETPSKSEIFIMKIIWSADKALGVREVMARANSINNKDWKVQTVSTFLSRLVQRNFLTMERRGRVFYYHPNISEEEYGKKEMVKCIDFWGDGKIENIISVLAEAKGITEQDKAEIIAILDKN
ncbi:MAG: BlaI/MecI/CopY family transcriptional regulator [Clostridia bacterium]|nr:BlaI/MecI/CopY family transcriptional regulator [Clostridia bacterium]